MNRSEPTPLRIGIACGGTGGHLYPGLAVGECLFERGSAVTLFISNKEVDQRATRDDERFTVVALPAVGFSLGGFGRFLARTWRSYRQCLGRFAGEPVDVLLSMGGFTSAPPAWAARRAGARVFLHEANAIPGRANRWLARSVLRAYVHFPEAASRLRAPQVRVLGMPVRSQFQPGDVGAARMALGLVPDIPVLLVMGGSQGARGINRALIGAAPGIAGALPPMQILHLTGPHDLEETRAAYRAARLQAVVRPFLTEMEFALSAADGVVARAGASSLAEFAAMGVPPLLIPLPTAADNHQLANARAVERAGGALVLEQGDATPDRVVAELGRLMTNGPIRQLLKEGLAGWHRPDAASALAEELLACTGAGRVVDSRGSRRTEALVA